MSTIDEVVAIEPKPRSRGRVLKFLLRGGLLLVGVAVAAQLIFTFSGDGQWQYQGERNGVKIYSKKVPGSNLKKFEAVFRVKASLSSIVSFMQDNESDLDVEFYDAKILEWDGPQVLVSAWKSGFPKPFKDRDFVVKHTFTQDPATKEITYKLKALPDRLPRNGCCVRVPLMDNSWTLMPLKNGEVEITWMIDMDVGGFLPYFVINGAHPEIMTDFAAHLQGYFNRPKYVNVKLAWIVEPQP